MISYQYILFYLHFKGLIKATIVNRCSNLKIDSEQTNQMDTQKMKIAQTFGFR